MNTVTRSLVKTVFKHSKDAATPEFTDQVIDLLNDRETFEPRPQLDDICATYSLVYEFALEVSPLVEEKVKDKELEPFDLRKATADEFYDYIFNRHFELVASFTTPQLLSLLYRLPPEDQDLLWDQVFVWPDHLDRDDMRIRLTSELMDAIIRAVAKAINVDLTDL